MESCELWWMELPTVGGLLEDCIGGTIMRSYEMSAVYDSARSFYGKAVVEERMGFKTLMSYGTVVCTVDTVGDLGMPMFCLHDKWDFSATTLRHVKEFLRQAIGKPVPLTKARLSEFDDGGYGYLRDLEVSHG